MLQNLKNSTIVRTAVLCAALLTAKQALAQETEKPAGKLPSGVAYYSTQDQNVYRVETNDPLTGEKTTQYITITEENGKKKITRVEKPAPTDKLANGLELHNTGKTVSETDKTPVYSVQVPDPLTGEMTVQYITVQRGPDGKLYVKDKLIPANQGQQTPQAQSTQAPAQQQPGFWGRARKNATNVNQVSKDTTGLSVGEWVVEGKDVVFDVLNYKNAKDENKILKKGLGGITDAIIKSNSRK